MTVRILALNSAQRWRNLLSLPVGDLIAYRFNSAVGFGLQSSVALAAPGTWWCIVGSLDWGALFGRPPALVLRPDPAGLFCLLAPLLCCGLLLGGDPPHRGGFFRGNGRPQVGVVLLAVAGLGFGVTGAHRLAGATLVVSAIRVPIWWLICPIGHVSFHWAHCHRTSAQVQRGIDLPRSVASRVGTLMGTKGQPSPPETISASGRFIGLAEKPGFRYRRNWWPGGQSRVKGVDQRTRILPRCWEGPATGEQQPAARRPARQGAQHDRPEVLHVLGEQPPSLRARPREFLLVGLCAQVRPICYRDHVVTAFAQLGRDGG